jgi:nicotinic acid mononucleotide adenylyltransferase
MVRRLVAGSRSSSAITVDDRELVRFVRTGALSYAYDTLGELGQLSLEPAFVLGTDAFSELEQWHRFPELLQQSHWIVLSRKESEPRASGAPAEEKTQETLRRFEGAGLIRKSPPLNLHGAPEWEILGPRKRRLIRVPTDARALSSTAIRESLARTGKSPENSLTAEVDAYLSLRRLYGKAR